MSNFLERFYEATESKTPRIMLIGLTCVLAGAGVGYYKAKFQANIQNQNFSMDYLQNYISEDQVNERIDKTGKPAVIYYYQPSMAYHFLVRHDFIKGSKLCHEKADFYLVNLKKNLLQATEQIQQHFPNPKYLLQIRFPKQMCQIKHANGEFSEKETYYRQFFYHQYRRPGGVLQFLQENGIKDYEDPLDGFFELNRKCLFDKL